MGLKAMSRGFSGGNFSNTRNRSRVCLFLTTKNEQLFIDDNSKLWVEVITVTFFSAVQPYKQYYDVDFVETQTVHFA